MKPEQILVVEPHDALNLYPFTIMHSVWELRCGALRLFEKLELLFPDAEFLFHGRALQLTSFFERFDRGEQHLRHGDLLVLDASVLPDASLVESLTQGLRQSGVNGITHFMDDGAAIGAYIPADHLLPDGQFPDLDHIADLNSALYADARAVDWKPSRMRYLWNALDANAGAISSDAQLLAGTPLSHTPTQHVYALEPDNIFAGSNVQLDPLCVLDARKGPILLGDNVHVMAHATLVGPCAVGANSLIKIGAKIYGDCSFGEWCKVGGEVENSIIQAFSNKQHDGFLGHSFLSEWVNIGADTNTSDLKNNYGSISVELPEGRLNTGRMFLGLLCGDHTKSAINTMFTTGSVAGISASIVSGDFCDKYIPSFFWGGSAQGERYKIHKALVAAKTVMARRGKSLSRAEEVILRTVYESLGDKQAG